MTRSEKIMSMLSKKFFLSQYIYTEVYIDSETGEKEFCDCLIEFGPIYIIIQIKERDEETESSHYKWFENKVVGKAKKQLKDTYKFFLDNTNTIFSKRSDLIIDRKKTLVPVIVFLNAELTEYKRVVYSKTFNQNINIFSFTDFSTMLENIVLPYDIICYLNYRSVFKETDKRKLIFDNINEETTILGFPQNETDYGQMFLLRTYHSEVKERKVDERYVRFHNEILSDLNDRLKCPRTKFIEGLLFVDHVRATEIAFNWEKFVVSVRENRFLEPFTFLKDDRIYAFFAHPNVMEEQDFQFRMLLCLVYFKYKYKSNTAHVFIFQNEKNEYYSVSLRDFDLNTEIPYEEYIDTALQLFET